MITKNGVDLCWKEAKEVLSCNCRSSDRKLCSRLRGGPHSDTIQCKCDCHDLGDEYTVQEKLKNE